MDKHAYRFLARKKKQSLTSHTIEEKSSSICQKTLQLPEIQKAECICIYASTQDEVQTDALIQTFLSEGKTVCLPKIENKTLHVYRINSLSHVTLNAFGIREPYDSIQIHPAAIDVYIVPGLAFDIYAHRLGRGKGYYDRLLRNSSSFHIGLAFSEQIFPLLPTNTYDIVMDIVVTDNDVYYKTI